MVNDKLVEKMIPFIEAATPKDCPHCGNKITVLPEQAAQYIKQAILSDPNIVEIDTDAKLPETFFLAGFGYIQGHQLQVFLDEQGWVKKI